MTRVDVIHRAMLAERTFWRSLAVTAIAVLVPSAIRWLLGTSADAVPFVTYFPFVLVLAILCGWRWALLGTAVSALIVNFVFLPHPLRVFGDLGTATVFFYFVASCAFLMLAGDTLGRTVRHMARISEERDVLTREMYHRVQNTLSIVGVFVRLDRGEKDLAAFKEDLNRRIQALAEANRVLRDGAVAGSSVRAVVERVIQPFGAGAFDLQGEDCPIESELAFRLLLLLHEFCTNAIKHGALTNRDGRVEIAWQAEGEGFTLTWRECGGPPVKAPSRVGLGSRLLEAQRDFTVALDYLPTGLVARIAPETRAAA